MRRQLIAQLLVLCFCAAACSPPTQEDYTTRIAAGRARKDEVFRGGGEDSPILPKDVASFVPLAYFAIDESYAVPAQLEPAAEQLRLQMPTSTGKLRRALNHTRRLWTELRADEQRHRITYSREPEDGFVPVIYRWATTGDLTTALAAADASGMGTPLPAGDFVRWCRQVLDVLDQVRNAAPTPTLRATAKRAINDIRRGVVAVDAG